MYFYKGKAKIQVAVGMKKLYDKRLVKKKRDWQREKAKIFSRKQMIYLNIGSNLPSKEGW